MIAMFALMVAVLQEDPAWEALRARIESAPQDIATFIERRTGCNHIDGEVGSDRPEREQQLQDARNELRCGEIESDERALLATHHKDAELLKLLDDTKDLTPR